MRKKSDSEARESSLASGWVVEPDAGVEPLREETPEAETFSGGVERTGQVSNAALVLFGVFGGLYILYTWVWMTWAQYYSAVNAAAAAGSGSVGGVLQQIVYWAVPVAPALWFLSALLLNRHRTGRLAVSLLLGAVVLLPFPMFVSSGAAL